MTSLFVLKLYHLFLEIMYINKSLRQHIRQCWEGNIVVVCFLFMDDKLLRGSGNQIVGINFKSNMYCFILYIWIWIDRFLEVLLIYLVCYKQNRLTFFLEAITSVRTMRLIIWCNTNVKFYLTYLIYLSKITDWYEKWNTLTGFTFQLIPNELRWPYFSNTDTLVKKWVEHKKCASQKKL